MTGTKRCRECDQVKDLTEFFLVLHTEDGYSPMCKDCQLTFEAAAQKPADAYFEAPDG